MITEFVKRSVRADDPVGAAGSYFLITRITFQDHGMKVQRNFDFLVPTVRLLVL